MNAWDSSVFPPPRSLALTRMPAFFLIWKKKGWLIRHEDESGTWWEANKEKVVKREAPGYFFGGYVMELMKYKWPKLYNLMREVVA